MSRSHYVVISLLVVMSINLVSSQQCKSDDCGKVTSPLSRAVKYADNRQPYIPRDDQDAAAQKILNDLKATNGGKRPNFLWLVADDIGYGDLGGLWGGGARIGAATPNLNKLSAGGMSLMATYSQPTCTPSRAAMMTGRLPYRSGLIRPILAGDKITMNPWTNETSIAQQLSDSGYYSVLSGKWHTGEIEGTRPIDVGFDEFKGYYTSQKEITQNLDPRRYPDLVLNKDLLKSFNEMMGDKLGMFHGVKGGEESVVLNTTSPEQFAEADGILANFTIEKINELAAVGMPFFIAHNFMRCHADNWPSQEFIGKSASKFPYKDNLVEVDHIVGRIVKALDDAGVLENTFIFFTSDNGPQMDAWPDSGYTPFRGAKSTTWEGGVRVPGIAYWKNTIPAGKVSDGLFDFTDLYNSMLTMAGLNLEDAISGLPDMYMDGIDQASFLLTENGESKREHVYLWASSNFMGLRMREYKWHMKVVTMKNEKQIIDYANIDSTALSPWLYNLYIDPKEELPVGHRLNAWLSTMGTEANLHAATWAKDAYPPKDIGL